MPWHPLVQAAINSQVRGNVSSWCNLPYQGRLASSWSDLCASMERGPPWIRFLGVDTGLDRAFTEPPSCAMTALTKFFRVGGPEDEGLVHDLIDDEHTISRPRLRELVGSLGSMEQRINAWADLFYATHRLDAWSELVANRVLYARDELGVDKGEEVMLWVVLTEWNLAPEWHLKLSAEVQRRYCHPQLMVISAWELCPMQPGTTLGSGQWPQGYVPNAPIAEEALVKEPVVLAPTVPPTKPIPKELQRILDFWDSLKPS